MNMKPVVNSIAYVISRVIYLKNRLVWEKPAHPGKIIWIKPKHIERSIEFSRIVKQRRNYLDGVIKAGDWGKRNYKVKKLHSELFDAFNLHFNEDIPFEETKYFLEKEIGSDYNPMEYSKKYNKIYRQIKTEGFRVPGSVFDDIEPFKVSIAPNGDILFMTGKHRLAIAKALGDDFTVPAKVSHRHSEWQKYRDHLYQKLKKGEITKENILDLDHPDLYDLVD